MIVRAESLRAVFTGTHEADSNTILAEQRLTERLKESLAVFRGKGLITGGSYRDMFIVIGYSNEADRAGRSKEEFTIGTDAPRGRTFFQAFRATTTRDKKRNRKSAGFADSPSIAFKGNCDRANAHKQPHLPNRDKRQVL